MASLRLLLGESQRQKQEKMEQRMERMEQQMEQQMGSYYPPVQWEPSSAQQRQIGFTGGGVESEEMRRRRRRRTRYEGDDDPMMRMESMLADMQEMTEQNRAETMRMGGEMQKIQQMLDDMNVADAMALAPVVKKFSKGIPEMLEDAVGVIDQPPPTWKPYLDKKDYAGILKMETGELVNALNAKKPMSAIKKELTHTLAALMRASA